MVSTRTSKRTPATEVRANLIRAGRSILEDVGIAGLTIRAVASQAGGAPMGVYNHFDSKEGLLDALVTDAFDEFGRTIAATDDDAAERLNHSGRLYRQFAVTYPVTYGLMFSSDCTPTQESAERAFAVLSDIVRYGQSAGAIMTGDASEIAMQIWSCVHGAVSLELAQSTSPPIDHSDNYERVIALIGRGVRA